MRKRRRKEKLTGKNGLKNEDREIDGSKGRIDRIKGNGFSLSKISKGEIERMRRMRHMYREKKCVEDEATPSSQTGPTRAQHMSRALNVLRLEESSK